MIMYTPLYFNACILGSRMHSAKKCSQFSTHSWWNFRPESHFVILLQSFMFISKHNVASETLEGAAGSVDTKSRRRGGEGEGGGK